MSFCRQKLHIEPPRGWLNDPNGLCFFGGKYHVYFQYCPDSAEGRGEKGWGHWESPDLVSWRFTGMALRPDTEYDRDGAYSGSAIVCGDELLLYYTGNVKHRGDYDYITAGRESNTMLVRTADGVSMSEKQLLMQSCDYPDFCSLHVRDPKVFREADGTFTMLLGARSRDGAGLVLCYKSENGKSWSYAGRAQTEKPFGYMWECPDRFEVGGRRILCVCPQGLENEKYANQNIYQSGWFDTEDDVCGTPRGAFHEWDMGFDFYAPQSFQSPDGRRLLIGWMGLPDSPYGDKNAADGRCHCLTLPREVFLDKRGEICQLPAGEIMRLETETRCEVGKEITMKPPFAMHLTADCEFEIILDEALNLCYNNEKGELCLSFSDDKAGCGRDKRLARTPLPRDILVVTDTTSVEIYADGGRLVMTTRFYPSGEAVAVRTKGVGGYAAEMLPMSFDF